MEYFFRLVWRKCGDSILGVETLVRITAIFITLVTNIQHRGCITKAQLKTWKDIANGVPEDAPGFDQIDAECQDQVQRAFDAGDVVDRSFKGTRLGTLSESPACIVEESANGRAGCRSEMCLGKGVKISKGQLRVGYSEMFGEHATRRWKHWLVCLSTGSLYALTRSIGHASLRMRSPRCR